MLKEIPKHLQTGDEKDITLVVRGQEKQWCLPGSFWAVECGTSSSNNIWEKKHKQFNNSTKLMQNYGEIYASSRLGLVDC